MKYTLLELCQDIASSMDSDEFNSIGDSVEAQQIAKVVRTVYFDIITRTRIPEHYNLFNLQASGDNTKPVVMTLPSTSSSIDWLKYDIQTTTSTQVNYQLVDYVSLDKFLKITQHPNSTATNVGTMTYTFSGSTYTFFYYKDRHPQYYTSVDDGTYIFDAYDSTVDTTLTAAKSMAYGRKVITWDASDDFTPDLDEPQVSLLLNEAKALAWAELKQTSHSKAEQTARRHWVSSQKTKRSTDLTDFNKLPNFGRK